MKKNIVFIPNINTGNNRSQPYHMSVDSWKKWARQYTDVEVIEWTQPIMDVSNVKVTLQRYWVFDILEHNDIEYDQLLLVDADTIVHPQCPNFFNETDHKFCGVVNNGCYEWVTRSIQNWGDMLFSDEPKVKPWRYINGGFIIVNNKHKEFFDIVKNFYILNLDLIKKLTDIIKAGTDQTIINYLIQRHNVDIKLLPECYNLQNMYDKHLLHLPGYSWWPDELIFLKAGWVYHFNAIPQNIRHLEYWMSRTYNELYKEIK